MITRYLFNLDLINLFIYFHLLLFIYLFIYMCNLFCMSVPKNSEVVTVCPFVKPKMRSKYMRNICFKLNTLNQIFNPSGSVPSPRGSVPSRSVHVSAIQYFWFTIPRRRTENSKIDTLSCFPSLNTSKQQTVFDSNRSFGTFSHFCTVNNGLCL